MEVIRKHMDERRRKDSDLKRKEQSSPSGSASSDDSENKHKALKLDDYFIAGRSSAFVVNVIKRKCDSVIFDAEAG